MLYQQQRRISKDSRTRTVGLEPAGPARSILAMLSHNGIPSIYLSSVAAVGRASRRAVVFSRFWTVCFCCCSLRSHTIRRIIACLAIIRDSSYIAEVLRRTDNIAHSTEVMYPYPWLPSIGSRLCAITVDAIPLWTAALCRLRLSTIGLAFSALRSSIVRATIQFYSIIREFAGNSVYHNFYCSALF